MARGATQAERDWYFRNVVAPDCPNCGANPCYFLCVNSPHYYSAEQERADSDWNDAMSHDEWFRMAVVQYEQVHGPGSYCS